jgi:hypothetical protein
LKQDPELDLLRVVRGPSLFAAAMLAIIRSATRPRGLRPMLMSSAAMIPYCLAASTSKGNGLKVVASTRCTRMTRRARSTASTAEWTPAESSARLTVLVASSDGSSSRASSWEWTSWQR